MRCTGFQGLSRAIRRDGFVSLQLTLMFGAGIAQRTLVLGSSNFQGDEIESLCHPDDFQGPVLFFQYLLDQRKGPVQFLVTYAYGLIQPTFSSELGIRALFTFASILSLVCFFLIVRRLFSRDAALHATFLLATNGLSVVFGRILEHQSFVILDTLMPLLAHSADVRHGARQERLKSKDFNRPSRFGCQPTQPASHKPGALDSDKPIGIECFHLFEDS